ncbi:hypothetical protein K435DRAFT_256625 [Dendrothele bispora CBS 962.96]|uniref:Uncharacterized protein n=1 Tax=Dendrothele bispora (strain CBS 962.96) TaxID=1314807 RepID=A0A4V4HEF0_DENBC|nr:hypothetical protein K435DRAFT_256625 [Dendrothele bispora CBS 962.96]
MYIDDTEEVEHSTRTSTNRKSNKMPADPELTLGNTEPSDSEDEHEDEPDDDAEFDPEERQNDLAAADLFKNEMVIFASANRAKSHSSSRASSRPASPPPSSTGTSDHSDSDELSDEGPLRMSKGGGKLKHQSIHSVDDEESDWESRVPIVETLEDNSRIPRHQNLPTKKAEKLQSEFPQVSDKALPTSRLKSSTKSQSVKQHDHEEKKEDEPWLPRTDIVVHRQSEWGKTYYFQLEGQNEHIVQVMQKAFDIGKSSVLSVLDSEHCPVSPQGINAIALAALIAAAEKCGYTGGYDIADRLETGDQRST